MFKGSMVALVTPMNEDGTLDIKALQDLIDWHMQSKTEGIVIAGTTGESATLEPHEHLDLITRVVKQVAGRIPVIAGAGTNSTISTLKLVENARKAKADACLLVTPYYNKPPQNGLFLHFKAVAEKADIPIILYNVPARTSCDLMPETVERLSKINHIVGIKEATGKIERTKEIIQRCDKNFDVYSGDDATALDLMLNGAVGVISVTANVVPERVQEMCGAALSGNASLAQDINAALMLLHQRLFIEPNPIPAKWALQFMGKIQSGIRLPLLPLDSKYHDEVKQALRNAGVKINEFSEASA